MDVQKYKIWLSKKQIFLVRAAFEGTLERVKEEALRIEIEEIISALRAPLDKSNP